MTSNPLRFGAMTIPDGFEVRTQVTVLAPTEALPAPMLAKAPRERPRANLVVNRRAGAENPVEALDAFLDEVVPNLRGVEFEEPDDFPFDDGALGKRAVFAFEAAPGLRVVQEHVFRCDAGSVTQFTTTSDVHGVPAAKRLRAVVASFRP